MGRLTKISLIIISISALINGLPQEAGESPLKELLQVIKLSHFLQKSIETFKITGWWGSSNTFRQVALR